MYRYDNTNIGVIREYKNGNIDVRLNSDVSMLHPNDRNTMTRIQRLLDCLDCYVIGEYEGFETEYTVYNAHSDTIGLLTAFDERKLAEGNRTVKIYMHEITGDEWEQVRQFLNGGE